MESSSTGVARRRPRRVLVVEDDRDIRELLVELMSSEGYQVAAAPDGHRALAEAHVVRPDVILLDLMMPVMNGWQFREAQQRDPELADVPVIVVSAFDDAPGVEAVVKKPFAVEELLAAVKRLAA